MTQTLNDTNDLPEIQSVDSLSFSDRLKFLSFLGNSTPLWDVANETLSIVGVIFIDDYKRDEDGAYILDEDGANIPCKRTIFQGESGHLYSTNSPVAYAYVRDKLLPTINAGKMGMFEGVVPLHIGRQKTKAGRQTFAFEIRL